MEWICQTCRSYLKKNQIPLQARCNDLQVDVQPPQLVDHTPLERRLISRRYQFMTLIALPKGRLGSIEGNVPIDEQTVCSILPEHLLRLASFLLN